MTRRHEPPGRSQGEYRSAAARRFPNTPPGRSQGEYRSAQHEGTPVSASDIYLLDTNIVSHLMREPAGIAAQHVLLANSDMRTAQICTSVVVVCELLFGLRRRTHPRWAVRYDDVMANLDVKPLDAAAATHYADLRTRLEQAGTPIGPNDALIAAHALALGATLVSADAKFKRVPGLKLENWLQ